MHGVGAPFVAAAFEAFELPPYIGVKKQMAADPEFPTVRFPNPEEGKGALVTISMVAYLKVQLIAPLPCLDLSHRHSQ